MKIITFLSATAAMLVLAASCGQSAQKQQAAQQEEKDEIVKVDVLTWAGMAADAFGCMMEQTFGHRDARFNCSLKGYENKGSSCYSTDEYYEGPEFPEHLIKKVHPRLETIQLSWEGGRLQMAWFIFDREFTEEQIVSAFEINPNELPDNVYNMSLEEYHVSFTAFEHFGAGDMDCDGEMLWEIYSKLPASVMPHFLKTEEQRSEANVFEDQPATNRLMKTNHLDDGYELWDMAVYYFADDDSKAVAIVYHGAGLDGFTVKSDKTLKYDFKTEAFTEIERPIDPFTADELFDDSHFDSPERAAKAKAFWNNNGQPIRYRDLNPDGFTVVADIFGYDHSDEYGVQNRVVASRKWDGSRFVKSVRFYLNEDYQEVPYDED